jgi:short subunit dehydrogenase-like uncharacterized protein
VDRKTIFLMGGYGGAGSRIAGLLLAKTDLDLIIAGRHKDLAESLSRNLNQDFGCRTKGAYVDASDLTGLSSAFADADMVIAASTTTQYTEGVARAAIKTGIDYMDIHYPQRNVPVLMSLASEIKDAGLCFITQAGFHPGLPSVLTRFASAFFTKYRKSVVGVAMNTQFDKGGTLDEFIDSLGEYSAEVFKGGQWKQGGPRDWVKIDFGSSIGSKTCYPMTMEEMRALPGALGLEEAGVYAAGLNWFVDYLVTPTAIALGKVRIGLGRDFLASLMVWGLKAFSDRQDEVILVLEAEGTDESRPLKVQAVVEYNDAYYITAAPVAACLLQYLDGSIDRPGLWMMGHIVEPERFLNDMKSMGIRIDVTIGR